MINTKDFAEFENVISIKKINNNDLGLKYISKKDNTYTTKRTILEDYNHSTFSKDVEKEIINKIDKLTEISQNIEQVDDEKNIEDKINNNLENKPDFSYDNEFAIISNNFNENYLPNNLNILRTEFLNDDIVLYGFKNKPDQPGLLLVNNYQTLDNEIVKASVVEIGFFPQNYYFKLCIK